MIYHFVSGRGRGGLLSSLAMAVALAGGMMAGSALVAPAAQAQAQAASLSRPFIAAYQPVAAMTTGEAPDLAGAKAAFATVEAAIENNDDRNAAGTLALQIGNGLSDGTMQRRGLELMLASGKVPPAQVPQFNFFVGNLAFNEEDWEAARAALHRAIEGGYTENDPRGLILETYFQEERVADGVNFLVQTAETMRAAGQNVPANWVLRGLSRAYEDRLIDQTLALSRQLVLSEPTQRNWTTALQVVGDISDLDGPAQVDLYRLMRATDALTQRPEFITFIEALDPRVAGNEVLPLLEKGLAAGIFTADENYYREVKGIADTRAREDRNELESIVAEGRRGGAALALSTGDLLWSLGDYARAEEFYQIALTAGAERNTALTRKGMAQVMQGKIDDAKATLGEVSGVRRPVADMWAAYAEVKARA